MISIPFQPTADGLERVIAVLAEYPRTGSAVSGAMRRRAFRRYERLPAPAVPALRGWRHPYAQLELRGLRWASGEMAAPVGRAARPPAPEEATADRRALATAVSHGLVHAGGIVLAPSGAASRVTAGRVVSLAEAVRDDAAGVPSIAQLKELAHDKFAQLAIAFQNCGAFVDVPAGTTIDDPIQLIFLNAAAEPNAEAVFPFVVVRLGAGARATVIERHLGDGQPFVCGVVAVQLAAHAVLDYAVVQDAGEEARLIVRRVAWCQAAASLRWSDAELGATLSRSVLDVRLQAPRTSAGTTALFLNTGLQHVDLAATVRHLAADTTSATTVRSEATDLGQGRSVGRIIIAPEARGATADLHGDALLLSPRAQLQAAPTLEIATNGVRVAYGATVGSLDPAALFYVQSRGIAHAEAVRMMALAFFEPAIAGFPGDLLRDEIRTALDEKIDEATELGE